MRNLKDVRDNLAAARADLAKATTVRDGERSPEFRHPLDARVRELAYRVNSLVMLETTIAAQEEADARAKLVTDTPPEKLGVLRGTLVAGLEEFAPGDHRRENNYASIEAIDARQAVLAAAADPFADQRAAARKTYESLTNPFAKAAFLEKNGALIEEGTER